MTNPDVTSFVRGQLNSANTNELTAHLRSQPGLSSPLTYIPTPGSQRWSLGYAAGSTIPNAALNAGVLRPLRPIINNLGTNHLRSGLTGAGIGAVAGAGLSTLAGGDPTRGAVTGAGVGGLGMLLMSMYARNRMSKMPMYQEPLPDVPRAKSAFYSLSTEADSDIEDRVMEDGNLSYMDKSTLLRFVNQLSPDRKASLSRLIGPIAGAGVGAAIARYLLQAGIGGTALLGIVGAVVGGNMTRGQGNAFGQRVDTSRDVFGQKRYI